jgi:hypothetical protein
MDTKPMLTSVHKLWQWMLTFVLFSVVVAYPQATTRSDATGLEANAAVTREVAKCRNTRSLEHTAIPFPDATNTGVPPGAILTRHTGTLHIETDDIVISNLEVIGDIVIDARNVTIKNTRLISRTPWHALRIMDEAAGFILIDSEIDGGGTTENGVYGFGNILRSNIHDSENGMNIWGPSMVCDSFIHSLRDSKDSPHYDGIQIGGGRNIAIVHNTIINDHTQTSAIIMGNTFGGLSDIVIDRNRLLGGGYTVYLDGRKGGGIVDDASIKITNNWIEGGHWGSFALYGQKPVMSCNADFPEGSRISRDKPARCEQHPDG